MNKKWDAKSVGQLLGVKENTLKAQLKSAKKKFVRHYAIMLMIEQFERKVGRPVEDKDMIFIAEDVCSMWEKYGQVNTLRLLIEGMV